jgi:L-fuconolactonase
MSLVIDSHQHFWKLSQPAPFDYSWLNAPQLAKIKRDYLPEHLAQLIQQTGVQKTIFVQTQHNLDENRWVLREAERHDFIVGVVGWVDLASPACEEQLLEFEEHPKFVGIRHVTHDEPDDDFILRADVLRGIAVLERYDMPFDMLFFVKHLQHAQTLAERFPNLTLVLDHLSKPRIKEQRLDDWVTNFRAAARYPNVICKLSGMVTEADWANWKPADLRPYVQEALEAFGPERLMFGSDWPVCELAASYHEVYDALNEVLGPISAAERAAIFGETAARVYKLKLQ